MSPIDTGPFTPPHHGNGNGNGGDDDDTEVDPLSVHIGASAGGDLQGTYPNPTINPELLLGGSSVTEEFVGDAVDAEAVIRAASDTTLSGSITTEAAARAAADSTEATARAAAITSEASTRATADTTETTNRQIADALRVSKDAEQISVLNHGLSNNGSTDNLAAWNTLIAQINAGTYSDIWFPEGEYVFTGDPNPITHTNVHIHGAGAATLLSADPGARMGSFFTVGNSDGSTPAPAYVLIENFMLQCNAAGTGFEPTAFQNAINLYDGGHLVARNFIVKDVAGLVTVGTHVGTKQGTVSSVDSGTDTFTMSAAHGLSPGDQIIFAGTVPNGITAGQGYYVLAAGLTSTNLRVSLTAGGSTVDLTNTTAGATFDGGAFNARVQRYQVQNIIGTLNEVTTGANRIWVLNGTSGFYSSIQTVAHYLQGGSIIKTQPITNNDQHWFTDVHMQGGEDYWANIDVNSGDAYNWVFKQCVMDGSMTNAVWIHAERAANTATDIHFVDCHCSTWGGTPILINHNGTQDWRSLQWVGGRYKWLNGDGSNWGAVRIGGTGASNILSANFQGVNFLADHITITGLSASANTLSVTRAADGRGHGLNVGDKVVFNQTTNGITSDTAYLVYSVSASGSPSGGVTLSNDTFQIQPSPATGTPVDITGTFGSSFTLQTFVNAMMTFTDAQAVRVNSCHFGAFYGTPTYAKYAVVAAGSANYYNVQGNVARGLDAPTGGGNASFSDGSLVHDATLPQTTVYFNNVSDVGST